VALRRQLSLTLLLSLSVFKLHHLPLIKNKNLALYQVRRELSSEFRRPGGRGCHSNCRPIALRRQLSLVLPLSVSIFNFLLLI
jgi:hypothetical protein